MFKNNIFSIFPMSRPNWIEYFVSTRMAATRVGFRAQQVLTQACEIVDISGYYANPFGVFSCGFRLQCGGCTSQGQNLKFCAPNFDLHRSDPQRSGTPKWRLWTIFGAIFGTLPSPSAVSKSVSQGLPVLECTRCPKQSRNGLRSLTTVLLSEDKKQTNTNFSGRKPSGRTPGKEPFSQTPKSSC